MTLLSICQDAADEIGIQQPSSIISNADPDAQKLLRLANKVGKRLMKGYAWQVLRKEQTFTSVATETQTSILPSDFDRFVSETFWNRTDKVLLSGPIHATEWQSLKALNYSDETRPKFVHRGSSVLVIPTMSAGKTLAFEYVSQNWCQSSGGTGQTAWAADTDTGVLDEELLTLALIVAHLATEGLPLDQPLNDFNKYCDRMIKNDQPDGNILVAGDLFGLGSRHFAGAPLYDTTIIDVI